jgi:hypothetical protein
MATSFSSLSQSFFSLSGGETLCVCIPANRRLGASPISTLEKSLIKTNLPDMYEYIYVYVYTVKRPDVIIRSTAWMYLD